MAPEVMLAGHVSRAADVFAFGITLWEIFTSGHPYRGEPQGLCWCGLSQAHKGTARPEPPGHDGSERVSIATPG